VEYVVTTKRLGLKGYISPCYDVIPLNNWTSFYRQSSLVFFLY